MYDRYASKALRRILKTQWAREGAREKDRAEESWGWMILDYADPRKQKKFPSGPSFLVVKSPTTDWMRAPPGNSLAISSYINRNGPFLSNPPRAATCARLQHPYSPPLSPVSGLALLDACCVHVSRP